jgi:hypothetical protein
MLTSRSRVSMRTLPSPHFSRKIKARTSKRPESPSRMSAQADQVRDMDDDLRTLFRSALDGELSPQPTRSKLAQATGPALLSTFYSL